LALANPVLNWVPGFLPKEKKSIDESEAKRFPTFCEVCFWKCAGFTYLDADGKIQKIIGNENEFKHIILNLINNSKYEFLHKNKKDKNITINILGEKKELEFIDNAGGIPEDIIDDIFEMHISTKGEDGTGIGLYMSSQIAKKYSSELSVVNLEDGAKFIFSYKG